MKPVLVAGVAALAVIAAYVAATRLEGLDPGDAPEAKALRYERALDKAAESWKQTVEEQTPDPH